MRLDYMHIQLPKISVFFEDYVIIPFKGIYLEYVGKDKPISTNIYPVPNIKNPFLGGSTILLKLMEV